MPRIDLPIDKDWAWGGATGAGVTVAVVDSGVDAAHPAVGAVERAMALQWDSETSQVTTAEGPQPSCFQKVSFFVPSQVMIVLRPYST